MANIDYEKEMVGTVDVPEADKLDEAALTALKAALQETVAGEAFVTQMGDRGIVPSTDAPEDAATIYEAEIDTWAERILAVDFD